MGLLAEQFEGTIAYFEQEVYTAILRFEPKA
jgi:hypothetical protein